VTTIIPALGGPSSTTFHSSGEKAALDVIRGSFGSMRNKNCLRAGEETHDRDHPRAGARQHQSCAAAVLRPPA
jgi:hypothetical protein